MALKPMFYWVPETAASWWSIS